MGLLGRRHKNSDPQVRLKAVQNLDDQEELVDVACTDDVADVRMAAASRVSGDERLARIAMDAGELDVRLAVVDRIESQQTLAGIIKARKNFELMGACFSRITDRDVLESIAEDPGYNPAARKMAVEQFADESYLADLQPDDSREEPDHDREAAIVSYMDTYGDLRVVRAIGRFRRSEKALKTLGGIARKGGDAGGLAVEYLCRALVSSNPGVSGTAENELASLSDPELVSHLIRSLDDPKMSEPVRKVLQRIGTGEALEALSRDEGSDE